MAKAIKYHVNPATGRANICRATEKDCPHGSDTPHGDTKQEARAAYEKKKTEAGENLSGGLKKPAPLRKNKSIHLKKMEPLVNTVNGDRIVEKFNIMRDVHKEIIEWTDSIPHPEDSEDLLKTTVMALKNIRESAVKSKDVNATEVFKMDRSIYLQDIKVKLFELENYVKRYDKSLDKPDAFWRSASFKAKKENARIEHREKVEQLKDNLKEAIESTPKYVNPDQVPMIKRELYEMANDYLTDYNVKIIGD